MASIEIRKKGTYYNSAEQSAAQLSFDIDFPHDREVFWLVATAETRRRFIGHKVITRIYFDPDTNSPTYRYIDTNDISNLTDPKLRYALRFADAAEANSYIVVGLGMKSVYGVRIKATDQGVDSLLLNADYVGVVNGETDTFMESLHSAAPVNTL